MNDRAYLSIVTPNSFDSQCPYGLLVTPDLEQAADELERNA